MPDRQELIVRDPRWCWSHSRSRGRGNTMRKRIAASAAPILLCRVYRDRKVGDGQPLVLCQRHQYDVGVSGVEQGFVFDHDRGTQLIRLLRQRIPPVGDDDLTTRKAGQWLIAREARRTPLLIERRRLRRILDIFPDRAALRAYPLPPQAHRFLLRFRGDRLKGRCGGRAPPPQGSPLRRRRAGLIWVLP